MVPSAHRHLLLLALPLFLAHQGCLLIRPPPPANPEPDDPGYASRDLSAERGPLENDRGGPDSARGRSAFPNAREMTRGRTAEAPVVYGSANGDQAEPAPLPKRNPLTPTTIELRNDCTEPVSIAYGKTLRPDESGRARVSPGSFRSPPREPDGSLMIWILDPREQVIASARATAEATRVVIEKSCTSIRVD